MKTEKIYTVNDYYDGPISGVADLDGEPHYYECIFDNKEGEYSKNYRLFPIPEKVLHLFLDQWNIWLRWESAFKKGLAE